MSRQRHRDTRPLVVSTRVSSREDRAIRVIGIVLDVDPSNVVRFVSVAEALRKYDKILEVVRAEFQGAPHTPEDV